MAQVISRVLVGFDGSVDAQRALAWGIREAEDRHAALRVVVARGAKVSAHHARDWLVAMSTEWAHQAKEIVSAAGGATDVVELVDSSPSEVLVRDSDESTLVVVGSRGHGRIAGASLGSVSQHVSRQAAGPVVVVRPAANPGSTRIVVGVDGSGGSEQALDFAFDRASCTGAALFVLYGWRPTALTAMSWSGAAPFGAALTVDISEEARSAEILLAETVAGLTEKYPDVEVYREAIPVPAARALADASQNAAMVVVGSRGRGAFAGLLLGSVSQSVLHHAECPVVIVR